jgi:hypothetical protein
LLQTAHRSFSYAKDLLERPLIFLRGLKFLNYNSPSMKSKLVIGLIFIFIACQKDDMLQPKKNVSLASDPVLIGKRLSFNSTEHLSYFVDESKKRSLNELRKKVGKFEEKGFRSLLPTFDSTDIKRAEEFIQKKVVQSPESRAELSADADEDEIIYDPNFAMILNGDREIIVDDRLFKFTEYAVFYTETDNDAEIANYVEQIRNCELTLSTGSQHIGNNVYAFIPEPIDDICDYEVEDEDTDIVAAPTISAKDQFMQNMSTCVYEEHGFDHIFGPSKKCIDKFAKDRRIKTRAWNQNYLIYSSIGIRTKTQKRTMFVWWASDSDEIELGYEVVKYRFDGVSMNGIFSQIKANASGLNYVYSYNGYLLNQYGVIASNNNWGSGANLFDKWPINDGDSRVLKIYLGENISGFLSKIDAGLTTLDGKEFNATVKALTKQGWDAVSRYLKVQSSGGTVIVGGDPFQQRFYFVYTNWRNNNRNDNKVTKIFDFNTGQIGFSLNPGNGTNWSLESASKSYKEFAVACYGIARRGNTWRGNRIVVVQKE